LRNAIAAVAEGYPFPTNLDLDVPLAGLAPAAAAERVWLALEEEWTPDTLRQELRAIAERHRG
jgi:hypothetical protein